MACFKQRDTSTKIKEATENSWRWDWPDKVSQFGSRIGGDIRKLEQKGKAFCVVCAKVIMLDLSTLKYKRFRGQLIQVYKIINQIDDLKFDKKKKLLQPDQK